MRRLGMIGGEGKVDQARRFGRQAGDHGAVALAGGLAACAIQMGRRGVAGRMRRLTCRHGGHVEGIGHGHEGQAKDHGTAQQQDQERAHRSRPGATPHTLPRQGTVINDRDADRIHAEPPGYGSRIIAEDVTGDTGCADYRYRRTRLKGSICKGFETV